VDAALKLYKESKRVLQKNSFDLRKLTANITCLQKTIDEWEELSTSDVLAASTCDRPDETTYAKLTLGGFQTLNPTDQKVLDVK